MNAEIRDNPRHGGGPLLAGPDLWRAIQPFASAPLPLSQSLSKIRVPALALGLWLALLTAGSIPLIRRLAP
jgi:ABC-2 type transport system permease protein